MQFSQKHKDNYSASFNKAKKKSHQSTNFFKKTLQKNPNFGGIFGKNEIFSEKLGCITF